MAAPLKIQYANNLILGGDAARHVNSIAGGGIHSALSSGKIAGEFLAKLILSGRPCAKVNVKGYHDNWLAVMGNTMWKLYCTKKKIF